MDIVGTLLKNDLLSWAERAGGQFHKAGSEWRGYCPLHHGNNHDGFAIYQDSGKQKWKCFTGPCGQGDLYDFIMRWQGVDFQGAYRILGGEENPDPLAVARAAQEQAARAEAALKAQIEQAERALHELQHAQAWLAYHRQLLECPDARQLWRQRGLPEDWQDFYQLGYCPAFTVGNGEGKWITPTLTIPVKDENWQVTNIRHRLLKPPKPNDKYRPERPGLPAAPFIAHPGIAYNAEQIIVVEGEIKAMVTYSHLYREEQTTPQVIGIPGKSNFGSIADRLQGHEVYICLDPDADQEAQAAAARVHGHLILLPMKIDDAILAGALTAKDIAFRMRAARKA